MRTRRIDHTKALKDQVLLEQKKKKSRERLEKIHDGDFPIQQNLQTYNKLSQRFVLFTWFGYIYTYADEGEERGDEGPRAVTQHHPNCTLFGPLGPRTAKYHLYTIHHTALVAFPRSDGVSQRWHQQKWLRGFLSSDKVSLSLSSPHFCTSN